MKSLFKAAVMRLKGISRIEAEITAYTSTNSGGLNPEVHRDRPSPGGDYFAAAPVWSSRALSSSGVR